MGRKLLRNCVLLDPETASPAPGALLLEGQRIAAVLPADAAPESAEPFDLGGRALAPGFVDVHVHGRAIFAPAAEQAAALAHDSAALAAQGTTSFLTTTVAEPAEPLAARVEALAAALGGRFPGARPVGIHLEGPWINGAAAGAQPGPGIRAADPREAQALRGRAGGALRMVTLAPELENAGALCESLAAAGVRVALGHSLASAEQVEAAVRRGASHVTHLWNAMGPLHHRAPGLAGVALADDRLSCDLVCDGVHVDLRLVRVAARAKGEGLVLITDALDPPDPASAFGAGPLSDDGRAWRLADGRLAGSRTTLARALANARAAGALSRLEAVAAATLRPARLLGLAGEIGTLRPGARADLVVLDEADRAVETWIAGARL